MKEKLIQYIIERQLSTGDNTFIEIISFDDKKKGNWPYNTFFKVSEIKPNILIQEADVKNFGVYGVFFSLNPLSKNIRQKKYVKKIQNVFIDLDDATEEHKKIVENFLEDKGIKFYYKGKSKNGYHMLIPVDFEPTDEHLVKNFLNYLKEQICNKVDTATADMTRTCRFPESLHMKSDEEFQLEILYFDSVDENSINKNNEIVKEYQYENKKGELDNVYLGSVELKDTFFKSILNAKKNKEKYINYLKSAKDRNNKFVKNLGIFLSKNPKSANHIKAFLNEWEASRYNACLGWSKKSSDQNMTVNYRELLLWAKENKLDLFVLLLEKQLEDSFLDEMEFYFLDEEKLENSYLIYYPKKNYFVSKGFGNVLNTIYYDGQERGFEPLNYFKIPYFDSDGVKLPHSDRLRLLKDTLHEKLDLQKRIKKVHNINYKPIDEKFIWVNGKKFFNAYKKTYYTDFFIEEEKYNFPHIKELILNLCANEQEYYDWFINWLSWIVQNPTEKLPTAVIFQGEQGTGKGVFKNLILDNIFGDNCIEINQTNLESSFNNYLFGKQIIVANEVIHNENKALLPNILKNFVTDEYVTIQRKFKNELVCENFSHWIFCTNNENPLKIDEGDRRYSVFYSKKLKGGGKAANDFVKALSININYELEQFISYLKSYELDETKARTPIWTDAKESIIEINKSSFERFMEYLKIFDNFYDAYVATAKTDQGVKYNNGKKYLITESLYKSYKEWCNFTGEVGVFGKQMFSRKLSTMRIGSEVVRINDGQNSKPYRVFDMDKLEVLVQ